MRQFLIVCLLLGGCATVSTADKAKPTNFVFILVDDLGWADVSPNNPKTFYDTPNIQRLADSGMRFTNAYAACPVCSPTRASIMTGKYPVRTGVTDYIGARAGKAWGRNTKLLPPEYTRQLNHEETTIAEALKANGYATFFAGKWHLGGEKFWPEHQGFDVNVGGHSAGGPYGGKKYFSPYNNPRMKNGPDGEHLPDRLATDTASFIKANKDKPFLAYLSFYSVHTPLIGRPDLVEKYKKKAANISKEGEFGNEPPRKVRLVQRHAVYGAMVEAMDAAVGKVLDALKANGVEDNTVVIFFSDNGGLSTSEGSPTSNLPLRAGKGWMYEGGIREACFIRAPGVTNPGSVSPVPITSTDFYPTMLDLAGQPLLPDQHIDGVSLKPMFYGGTSPERFVRPEYPRRQLEVDTKRVLERAIYWHYPHYGNQGGAPSGAIRQGDWKLIEWYEDDKVELFNLADDIGETKNLADAQPERAARMKKLLHDWLKDTDAKMPAKNPKFNPDKRQGR